MLNTTYDSEAAAFSLWSPEDIRQASERAVNLWVGVMSPYWAPFFAASGFGLGAWAMSRSLMQSETLAQDLPLVARWPGFTPLWGQKDFTPDSLEPVADAADEVTAKAAEAVKAVAPVVETAADTVVEATGSVAAPMVEAAEDLGHAVIDPVAEVPVVPAVAEALAEPAIEAATSVAPKPIAEALAVAKPQGKASPKPAPKPAK